MSDMDMHIADQEIEQMMAGKFPQDEADGLMEKFQQTIALCAVVERNFKDIRQRSLMLGMDWSSNVESLLAHLEIDLAWLQKEFKQIRG